MQNEMGDNVANGGKGVYPLVEMRNLRRQVRLPSSYRSKSRRWIGATRIPLWGSRLEGAFPFSDVNEEVFGEKRRGRDRVYSTSS